jgi:hypothetical protein
MPMYAYIFRLFYLYILCINFNEIVLNWLVVVDFDK